MFIRLHSRDRVWMNGDERRVRVRVSVVEWGQEGIEIWGRRGMAKLSERVGEGRPEGHQALECHTVVSEICHGLISCDCGSDPTQPVGRDILLESVRTRTCIRCQQVGRINHLVYLPRWWMYNIFGCHLKNKMAAPFTGKTAEKQSSQSKKSWE